MLTTLTRDLAVDEMPFLLSLVADMEDWPPWTEDQFLYELPEKWSLSFIGEGGAAILSRRAPMHIHVHLLAVAPAARGSGVGARLMQEIKTRADGSKLTLKVPRDSEGAVAFYQRHGFLFEGETDSRWAPMALAFRV